MIDDLSIMKSVIGVHTADIHDLVIQNVNLMGST